MLLIAAATHIFNSYQLLNSILDYRLLSTALAVPVAAVLPYAQLTVGVALLFVPAYRRTALAFAALLFVAFLTAQSTASVRGLDIGCGCFGGYDTRIGWRSLTLAGAGLGLSLIALAGVRRDCGLGGVGRPGHTLIETLVVIAIMALLIGLLLAAIQKVRATAARTDCQNRMKQLGLAVQNYHASGRPLPPGLSLQIENGTRPYLGWPARLLPYLERNALWTQVEEAFATDPAPLTFYGHPPHARLLATPVGSFACPVDDRTPGPVSLGPIQVAFTSYLGVEGVNQFSRDGLFYLDSTVRLSDVTDGTSQTLCLGERPPAASLRLGWWYRGWGQSKDGSAEMLLGARERNESVGECAIGSYHYKPGRIDDICSVLHFWSLHPGGANFAFADGSVRFLRYEADSILPALATRAGGEVTSLPE
jgi:prepilin-type processing-associated H-X9-DG protein